MQVFQRGATTRRRIAVALRAAIVGTISLAAVGVMGALAMPATPISVPGFISPFTAAPEVVPVERGAAAVSPEPSAAPVVTGIIEAARSVVRAVASAVPAPAATPAPTAPTTTVAPSSTPAPTPVTTAPTTSPPRATPATPSHAPPATPSRRPAQ